MQRWGHRTGERAITTTVRHGQTLSPSGRLSHGREREFGVVTANSLANRRTISVVKGSWKRRTSS
jgi:hypothetical protein